MAFLIGKRTPQGYACLIDNSDGKVNPNNKILKEVDTYTCGHARAGFACQKVIYVPTGKTLADMGAKMCHQCEAIICPKCAATRECTPFMKAVEAAEERDFRLREYGFL